MKWQVIIFMFVAPYSLYAMQQRDTILYTDKSPDSSSSTFKLSTSKTVDSGQLGSSRSSRASELSSRVGLTIRSSQPNLEGLKSFNTVIPVTILDRSGAGLQIFSPRSSNTFNQVRVLILTKNNLESLDELAQTLEEIDISHNKFTQFPSKLLKCSLLKKLTCHHNQMSSIPDLSQNLLSLEEVNAAHNALTQMPKIGHKVHSLNLSNNAINQLPEDFWQLLAKLVLVNLAHNNISSLPTLYGQITAKAKELSRAHTPADVGKALEDLMNLKSKKNQLSNSIQSRHHKKNIVLDLSYNQLHSVPMDIGSFPINKLDLSHNKLTRLPTALTQLSMLEYLNLFGNPDKLSQKFKKSDVSYFVYAWIHSQQQGTILSSQEAEKQHKALEEKEKKLSEEQTKVLKTMTSLTTSIDLNSVLVKQYQQEQEELTSQKAKLEKKIKKLADQGMWYDTAPPKSMWDSTDSK